MAFWKNKGDANKEKNQKQDVQLDEASREKIIEKRQKRKSILRWRLLVGALFTFIVLLGLAYGAITYTSTPAFCSNCHEMKPEYVTFHASSHNQNTCTDCHIKPGTGTVIEKKLHNLNQIYFHIIGTANSIQVEGVSEESCKQCHSQNRLVSGTGDLIVNHKGHVDEGITCTICHSGVVHARIAERGLNDSSSWKHWSMNNASSLMGDQYQKPNMGTCIDCHDQVNQGKQPWKDVTYSFPYKANKKKEEKVDFNFEPTPEMEAGVLERDIPENTQKMILQAIGKQTENVKIPLKCETCHKKIATPKNHDLTNWRNLHGNYAEKDISSCLSCHDNAKWIKNIDKQDIKMLLAGINKASNEEVEISAKEASRSSHFCATCHITRPDNHLDRYNWLYFSHPRAGVSKEQRVGCYFCHDRERPDKNSTKPMAPSDVYCEFCHEDGFRDDEY